MSTPTTPTTPASAPKPSVLQTDLAYLARHLVLLALVVILAVGGIYAVENLIARHDLATESKYSSLLAGQAQQVQTLETQLTTFEAQSAAIQQALMKQNAVLANDITTENQKIAQQQKTDATLSAQQAAAKLTQQTNAKPGEVTAQNDDVLMDLPISRDVVSDLDELTGVQAELTDTKTELTNETTVAMNVQQTVTKQNDVITGLEKQNVDQVKACAAEVTAVKAQARKGKIKAFFIGVGTALAAIAGHAL